MPTTSPRIHVTFKPETAGLLKSIARHEQCSLSELANALIAEALERREDFALSTLAEERELICNKRVKHANAWS